MSIDQVLLAVAYLIKNKDFNDELTYYKNASF